MVSGIDVRANLTEADRLIGQAASAGAGLVALPENFALMGEHELDKVNIREVDGSGPIQQFLSATARKYGVWIVGGTLPLEAEDDRKVMASCLVYDDRGERVGRYDKIHLFDVSVPDSDEEYRESDSIAPGSEQVVVATPFGKLGLSVCYDLRFPELYRRLAMQGAEILIVPAAFTAQTGAAHWEVLLRARAIENLCYVIAPNQGGLHANGRNTFGHSMIVDPWGTVLNCNAAGSGYVCAEVDHGRLEKVRAVFPVLQHRRFS